MKSLIAKGFLLSSLAAFVSAVLYLFVMSFRAEPEMCGIITGALLFALALDWSVRNL